MSIFDRLYDPFNVMEDEGEEPEPEEETSLIDGVRDAAAGAAKTAIVNRLPGAGTLFNYSAGSGLDFTPTGQKILMVAAAYGAWRMLSGGGK